MSFWTSSHTPEVAHVPASFVGRSARWACGGHANHPVEVADLGHLRRCQKCDGAVLGPVVYRCSDGDGRLLYAGSTSNIVVRLLQHSYQAKWWDTVERIDLERYPDMPSVRWAESRAIRFESPLHNRRGRVPA